RLEVARDALDVEKGWPGFRYEYSTGGSLLTAVTNSEGERIEYAYQASRRIRDVVQIGEGNPAHRFEFYAPGSGGLYRTVHTNPTGARTRYRFDAERRLRKVELLETGAETTYAWQGRRLASVVLTDGTTTWFTHVGDDLASWIEPSGNIITFTYQPGGLNLDNPFARPIRRIEDGLGLIEERIYYPDGRVQDVLNGEGERVSFTYNPAGLVDSITNPGGATWTYPRYGVHGHWLEVQGATTDQRFFDPAGNAIVTSAGRQEGGILSWGYDADRNPSSVEVAATEGGQVTAQATVTVTRRSDGQPAAIARPGGADHQLDYDLLGRLQFQRELVDGIWQSTAFEYDLAGSLTARSRPNGMREEFQYDGYGRVTRRRGLRDGVLEGEAVFTYQAGRLATVHDSVRDATETYAYDLAGRLETVTYGFGETLTLEYDLRSRVSAEIYSLPGQGQIRRVDTQYDLANRQVLVTTDGGELLLERVFTDGKLDLTRYGNGLERDYTYDPASGQLIGSVTRNALDEIVEDTAIVREAKTNPLRFSVEVETNTSVASTRERYWLGVGGSLVDPDKLVGKRVWHWNDGQGGFVDFVYDELSNQLTNASGDAFVYNAEGNRLLSATLAHQGETRSYTYDAAGFATSRDGVPITWTVTGRMASFGPASIEWDMLDRPVSWTVAGITREFLYFGGRMENDPLTGALGPLDLGAVSVQLDSSERTYRHLDFRGNVSFVSDESGEILTHYRYSPYGVDAVFGAGGESVTFVGRNEFGGLMMLGERIYDPAVGRFLSPDPVFQLLNQYTYTLGNPVFYWDPDGAHPKNLAALQQAYDKAVRKLIYGG
ncbi:MAG: RHS repeat-associated core domain-containing protein, partial [Gemmatimonadota bacterium]